jgi:hypothetical protein
MDFEPEGREHPGDDLRRAVLLERGLRMGVDVAPPGGHLAVQLADAIDDRHAAR